MIQPEIYKPIIFWVLSFNLVINDPDGLNKGKGSTIWNGFTIIKRFFADFIF